MSHDPNWWFPWFPTRFRRKTYHLSLAEDGAYRRLIDEYMITREPLPNDDRALARILGIPTAEWECIAPRVRGFFRTRNDKLVHKTCEEELRKQEMQAKRLSERGKKGAFAKHSKINGLAATSMLVPGTIHNKEKIRAFSTGKRLDVQRATAPPVQAEPPKEDDQGEKPAPSRPHLVGRAELEVLFASRRKAG